MNHITSFKAIETVYNNYHFRSRLEARWAVFFDTLNIPYRYEPEGFDLDGMRYLPDFFLPAFKCWFEVKPSIPTPDEREKAIRLCLAIQRPVMLFAGDVWQDVKGYGFIPFTRPKEELKKIVEEYEPQQNFWLSTDECIVCLSDGEPCGYNFERQFAWSLARWGECFHCHKPTLYALGFDPHSLQYDPCRNERDEHSPRLLEAYTAARSARFEHGEKGRQS